MGDNKFKEQLIQLAEISDCITENTELYKYIKQINDSMYSDGKDKLFEEKYKSIIEQREKKNDIFLSVIVRSQGNRPTGLREALLCLRAQTNQDFEIILIAHKADGDGKKCINQIISEQPLEFRKKIRYIELDRGTRTTPINVGFANAMGEYIAIFDDDDLLFDNWVQKFSEAAEMDSGKILHVFALAQKWKAFTIQNTDSVVKKGYMAIDAPTSQFCEKFDYLSQLVLNRCPLMSLAFPSYIFQKLGIIFNEKLDVTEDWEYFMRVVSITGITDIEEATSIYRLWVNEENSATLHDQTTWLNTYLMIQENMNSRAMLLPKGYTRHVISLIQRCNEDDMKMASGYPKIHGLLYYGFNYEFSDEQMLVANNNVYAPGIDMNIILPKDENGFKYFRFDPCEYGGFILRNLKIIMNTEQNGKIEVRPEECIHNGLLCEDGIYYMHYDPQIAWNYSGNEKVVSITIQGDTCMEIPEGLIEIATKKYSIESQFRRKCKQIINKIVRR